MQSNVYVTVSGPALSLLLYENTKTAGYQMGFLLGAVVNQVTDTISDSQISGEKTETIINISSILPVPNSSSFIRGSGKIDEEKLVEILRVEKSQQLSNGRESHDIVGWFSFKRNSTFQMSMRENNVHRQLSEMSRNFSQDVTPELFVLCLLSNNLMTQATHTFKHSFMRFLKGKQAYELIPLQIHNLGMSQTAQYQITACAPSRAKFLKELFDRIRSQEPGRDLMLQAQSELQLLLNKRVQKLSEVESHRIKLEQEVEDLKKQLHTKIKGKQNSRRTSTHSESNSSGEYRETDKWCGEDSEVAKLSENHVDYEPTSPVFKTQQRRNRHNRTTSPEF